MPIMRHFEMADLEAIRNGTVLPDYNGFVYGHHGELEPVVAAVTADGHKFLRYLNVLTMPEDDWHDPWFDWVRQNVPPLVNDKGIYALFPWYNHRKLWDWSQLGIVQVHALVGHVMRLRDQGHGAIGGFFLDQFWNTAHEWMFDETGAPYSDFDPGKWYYWRRNIEFFLKTLRKRFLLRQELVLINGTWARHLMPCMFENAARSPELAEDLYPEHKNNLISVDARSVRDVQWAMDLWLDGVQTDDLDEDPANRQHAWISFGGPDQAAIEAAYRLADQME